jgi:hypothetical protein
MFALARAVSGVPDPPYLPNNIKSWDQLLLAENNQKMHAVLGQQLSSLSISEPLILLQKPVMTVGPVKYTPRVGESTSKIAEASEELNLKFGKFRRFNVPESWIPKYDSDEDDDQGEEEVDLFTDEIGL